MTKKNPTPPTSPANFSRNTRDSQANNSIDLQSNHSTTKSGLKISHEGYTPMSSNGLVATFDHVDTKK